MGAFGADCISMTIHNKTMTTHFLYHIFTLKSFYFFRDIAIHLTRISNIKSIEREIKFWNLFIEWHLVISYIIHCF